MTRARKINLTVEILIIIFSVVFFVPFYFIFINSFKTLGQILTDPSSLPTDWNLANYMKGVKAIKFPTLLFNSIFVTSSSIILISFLGSLASWKMARFEHKRLFKIMYICYTLSMIIPFQTVMVPVVSISSFLNMLDLKRGLVFLNIGFGLPLTVFLFHGFIGTVPYALEESARIDGANDHQVFFRIVLPLLKPITITIAILNTLWIWNDFLLPSLVLFSRDNYTIPIGINMFFGLYDQQWDKALSILVLSIVPIVGIFLFLQKYFIAGITSGAVKG
ncbi:MAG: carbohydrate ABC transporter permease [Sphaerochaetaceae bacterium]